MKKIVGMAITISVSAIFLFYGTNTLAGWGKGCPKRQGFSAGGSCGGCGWGNLKDEEFKKAQAERDAFFSGVADLRQTIFEKKLELAALLAKREVDGDKAKALRKSLSSAQAEFDMKRLEHILRMKAINPLLARGCIMEEDCCMNRGGRGMQSRRGTGCPMSR